MKCIALKHVAFEDLGTFRETLENYGFDIEYRQAGRTPLTTTEWQNTPLIVVLGGPIGVYETDKYPWLRAEIEGLKNRLAQARPTLGICLGAQLMAAALGAKVYAGKREIGWSTLQLTAVAVQTPMSALSNAPVLHWHGDTFDLPSQSQGVTLLASTAVTPHQAFAVGTYGLATQFHAEADGAAIEEWLIGHTCELAHAQVSVPVLREQTRAVAADAAHAGRKMLSAWLKLQGWQDHRNHDEQKNMPLHMQTA